jgi:hypothetical protein
MKFHLTDDKCLLLLCHFFVCLLINRRLFSRKSVLEVHVTKINRVKCLNCSGERLIVSKEAKSIGRRRFVNRISPTAKFKREKKAQCKNQDN